MCIRARPYTVGEDTIYGVDFAERIAYALARTDYREAVRLLYLQTLKQLSDGKRIDWQLYNCLLYTSSHDHWDHLDYETVMQLKNRVDKVVCPLGVGEHFEY